MELRPFGKAAAMYTSQYCRGAELLFQHVFCEECISTWFDREKTCPMCRAEVSQEDVTWKCGSTTWLVQLF